MQSKSTPVRDTKSGHGEPTGPLPSLPTRADNDFDVVAIGASAGGLDACKKLISALPPKTGMSFILVQHLEPTHQSMMVALLASHTRMAVLDAVDGTPVEPEHLYVIPPATYLSVSDGKLRLSPPKARQGARLPFDYLLHSVAKEYGARAICVVLSGTGADGSLGLKTVAEHGGRVFAQDPSEAEYGGMPGSAIDTDAKVVVLPASQIAEALVGHGERPSPEDMQDEPASRTPDDGSLTAIIEILRSSTPHDFRSYKPGTLQRRIQRRMGMSHIAPGDVALYIDRLRLDADERDALGQDLLINVTGFFRDPKVFAFVAEQTIPALIRECPPDRQIRIWIAGCSTGEEAYSLAMLHCEQITAGKRDIKLQVFASDVDVGAVSAAREGLYPTSIEADVSAERLARFFVKDEHGYRVSPELRALLIFTVQNVLVDPPFSRLDFVSCRNLLIYLDPEAQSRVISLLHFSLRPGGMLLLGSAETAGKDDGRFEMVSKANRLYRHVGRRRSGAHGLALPGVDPAKAPVRVKERSAREHQVPAASHEGTLADVCHRMVLTAFAPAVVLVNERHECLFSLGPTERYLRVPMGAPTQDLLAMVPQEVRTRLQAAIHRAAREKIQVVVPGGKTKQDGRDVSFVIDIRPVTVDGQRLHLVCFVENTHQEEPQGHHALGSNTPKSRNLERELARTRKELQAAVEGLELSSEHQNAISEEASSVREEYQSTNEELMASKEELQSLIEELTATNGQLQETLERQRTTSDDLQNVIFSTEVATLFLDADLKIRFFTPSTKALFSIISTDVGRPLSDLHSLAGDGHLELDARSVLGGEPPVEREIETPQGIWFNRRVLPYRTGQDDVEGVVITFTDVTERKRAAGALEASSQRAELATVAKSRFLAAASHDLRQPLQTLTLLQGLLAKAAVGSNGRELVARLDRTLGAMSGLLDALLDINQIEAGIVRLEPKPFPIDDLLDRLRDEFVHQARSQHLALKIRSCEAVVRSDPGLLEQVMRNLISNALKYTAGGKVLVGCRRRGGNLSVEVWDTGIGIPATDMDAIFEEYHQVDNAARERSRGLGLGLFIVKRLCKLLGHQISVSSRLGKGSAFRISVERAGKELAPAAQGLAPGPESGAPDVVKRRGTILIVEDDPDVRATLELLLDDEGHVTLSASDGPDALGIVAGSATPLDLIVADYNLPNGMNGFDVADRVRERLGRHVPVVVLTGDIAIENLRDTGRNDHELLKKPVTPVTLLQAIQRLLPTPDGQPYEKRRDAASTADLPIVYVVDDDVEVRRSIGSVLREDGRRVETFASCAAFMDAYLPGRNACLLLDAYLPGTSGLELLEMLRKRHDPLPTIMITGRSDVRMAVQAMKAGASDFIDKPVGGRELLRAITRALEQATDAGKLSAWRKAASAQLVGLTFRQKQIMTMVLAGQPSKVIASDLGISRRTVEGHRASIMKKTGVTSLPALARLALAASHDDSDSQPRMPTQANEEAFS